MRLWKRRSGVDRRRAGGEADGAVTIHLIKLCVGCDSVDDLAAWIERHRKATRKRSATPEHVHVTRMVPRRVAELLDGGSLYWVIKGAVQARQTLIDIRPFVDDEGMGRCRLVMAPSLVRTRRQPRRPFQGWRYLPPGDAPRDLAAGGNDGLPPGLGAELAELGLR